MADKLTPLIVTALSRAALSPDGAPLFGTKQAPGLFPASAASRQAAQRAREEGLIANTVADSFVATEKGLAYLAQQANPKHVLEDIARAVESRQGQLAEISSAVRQMHASLQSVGQLVERLLPRLSESARPTTPWTAEVCDRLGEWHENAPGDCPLPDLYRQLRARHDDLTIGRFHDGLRGLYDREHIYLHPWTGPLYTLPEPAFALLVGHEVAYYASLRVRAENPAMPRPEVLRGERCAIAHLEDPSRGVTVP